MFLPRPDWRQASALVPLVLLSGGWTASLALPSAGAASDDPTPQVPAEAVLVPASVSAGGVARAVPTEAEHRMVTSMSSGGIPAAALAAYQRAAQVIGSADSDCQLAWPLLAAIGRVESDHGRYGGSVLSAEGVATPAIIGTPLDGSSGTQRITDTDAGQYDGDTTHDRAVGPMQFIPSTWSVVGVDGDGDKKRDPQDIDDAALASAVYLCSGQENLGTAAGVDSAVYRYNHSDEYVALVKRIAASYAAGDYASVPNSSYGPVYFSPSQGDSIFDLGAVGHHPAQGTDGPGDVSGAARSPGPASGTSKPGQGGSSPPPEKARKPVTTIADAIAKVPDTVSQAVTELQVATDQCATNLTEAQLLLVGGLQACAEAYVDGGASALRTLLSSLGLLGGLAPKP